MKQILIHILVAISLLAQNRVLNPHSKITIDGTSTLHDWQSVVEKYQVKSDIAIISDSLKLTSFYITMDVTSIKSGKESMDENTYDAMEAEDFPQIIYELSTVDDITLMDTKFKVNTKGNLTIHGESKAINLSVTVKNENGVINLAGEKKFKMSEYGIDPPTMFLGTITTGDEITIKFNLNIKFNQEDM